MAFPVVAILGFINKIVDQIIPDPQKAAEARIKLAELAAKGESEELNALVSMTAAQTDLLKIDAASDSMFQKGWRPLAGWAAVIGGVVYPLVRAILPWILEVCGVKGIPLMPALDTTEIMALLFSVLGIGTMRTVEKFKK